MRTAAGEGEVGFSVDDLTSAAADGVIEPASVARLLAWRESRQRSSVATTLEPDATAEDVSSRARILEMALRLFARYGYDGVSLQDIARATRLGKSTLFHHFTSKGEIWREAVRDELWQLVALLEPLERDEPPTMATLIAVVERVTEHFLERPDVARVLLGDLLAPDEKDSERRVFGRGEQNATAQLFSILARWFDRARRAEVIRWVNVRQTLLDLVGLIAFYPATAREFPEITGSAPFSAKALRTRKESLGVALRRMLEST